MSFDETKSSSEKYIMNVYNRFNAVSYTHLDVYKRQFEMRHHK